MVRPVCVLVVVGVARVISKRSRVSGKEEENEEEERTSRARRTNSMTFERVCRSGWRVAEAEEETRTEEECETDDDAVKVYDVVVAT